MRRTSRKVQALQWREEASDDNFSASGENSSTSASTADTQSQLEQLTNIVFGMATGHTNKATSGSGSIPYYNPGDRTASIGKWLDKVDELKVIHGWNEVTTAEFATSKLSGYAQKWYANLKSVRYSWQEWKEKLRAAFPEKINYSASLEAMIRRVQMPGESVVKYYYDKLGLLELCEIYDDKAVSCIISGLRDNHIKMTTTVANFETPENLLTYLKVLEEGSVPEREFNRHKRAVKRPRDEERYQRRNVDDGFTPRRKCYGCGSRDHILPNCDKRKRCDKCQRSHYGKCDAKAQNVQPGRKDVNAITEDKTPSKKFFSKIHINDVAIEAFIDLGSECNTMKQSIAVSLGLDFAPKKIHLRGFGGNSVASLGVIENVKVRVDEAERSTHFLVVPNGAQNIPVIIGQPFTEQQNIIVYKDSNVLRVFENSLGTLPAVIDLPPIKSPFWTTQSTVLPPKHVVNVVCTTKAPGEYFIDCSTRMKENGEYCVLRCIVETDENNECVLPVINPTDKEVVIKPTKIFARGEKCMQQEDIMPVESSHEENLIGGWKVGKTLTVDQQQQLLSLLERYSHCFSSSLQDLGCTAAAELKIDLIDDTPVAYKPYRMNLANRQKVKEIVDELLENNVIRESCSPFASPVILVKKKDGEQRLCIDYRKLNQKIQKDKFPLPRIDDQLDQLQGQKYFTTLDLMSGYYQIPVEEGSRPKTSFVTPDGQFEFNRMPFGITTAPSVFQRMMYKILGPLRGTAAMIYLDDILIPSKDFDQGIDRLGNVLDQIAANNLTLKPEKCHFFETSIFYLGFEVDGEGIRPGAHKTECIRNFPTPKTIHNVRQFLGLTGFFRQFIQNYSLLIKPLTNLLKKEQKWRWTDLQNNAFLTLKQKLAERPILVIYNPLAQTEVHTDASKNGVAGILLQRGEDGKQRAVAYYSRQTTPAEEKYHSYELETLAVVESLKKFRVYLLDINFKVITDCSAITAASKKKDLIPRIARWWLDLQEFTFEVEHRPGTRMAHVDALSRNPVQNGEHDESVRTVLRIEAADWILASQLTDDKVKNICDILGKKPTTEYENNIHREFKLENERVYKITNTGLKWLVPKGMRNEIVRASHDEVGHFALEKTLRRICENYWFANMRNYVQRYINSCIRCLYHKAPRGKKPGMLNPIEKISTPFDTIHMDHLGPFIKSTTGKKYLIVCVEAFTKYTMLYAVKSTKTQPVMNFLNIIISQFGVPRRLITDRGTCYTSKAFQRFCDQKGIQHIQNAVATPRANGQVERYNSTILSSLAASAEGDNKWDREIPKVQFGINSSVHAVTKKTPFELLYGFQPTAPSDAPIRNEVAIPQENMENVAELRRHASLRIKQSQQKQKAHYDKKRGRPKRYSIGDIVVVRKQTFSDGQSKKLQPKYKGPFRIVKTLPNDRVVIRELAGSGRSRRAAFENIESVEHLKRWVPPGAKSDSSEVSEEEEFRELSVRVDEDVN